jgi:hypothetical protein
MSPVFFQDTRSEPKNLSRGSLGPLAEDGLSGHEAAIDADTKLLPSFMIGTRGAQTAKAFVDDLASRLANRVQLTTDGHRVYNRSL